MTPPMAAAICSSLVAPNSLLPTTPRIAAIKANELPRKVGMRPPVHKWKIKVPTPAAKSATPTSKPVSSGTRIVAQDMAKACWKPRAMFLPALFFGYSCEPGNSLFNTPMFFPSCILYGGRALAAARRDLPYAQLCGRLKMHKKNSGVFGKSAGGGQAGPASAAPVRSAVSYLDWI